MRATDSTSPFLRVWARILGMTLEEEKRTLPVAVARRNVGCLWEMETTRASDLADRCGKNEGVEETSVSLSFVAESPAETGGTGDGVEVK